MKKIFLILLTIVCFASFSQAQQYFQRKVKVPVKRYVWKAKPVTKYEYEKVPIVEQVEKTETYYQPPPIRVDNLPKVRYYRTLPQVPRYLPRIIYTRPPVLYTRPPVYYSAPRGRTVTETYRGILPWRTYSRTYTER